MSVTLKLKQALKINGLVMEGNDNDDQTITLTNGVAYSVVDLVVADNYGTKTMWTTGDGGITTFTHGFIFSNQDIMVELRTDNATPEYVLFPIKANVLTALPATTGGDTTESLDGAILVDGTDTDDVDRIEVQRNAADGSGDATVSLFLFN